jgi:hypothetical protein
MFHTLPYRCTTGASVRSPSIALWGELLGDMGELDKQSLTYRTDALEQATELIGHVNVSLYVNADTASLSFWYVRLEDLAPDGSVTLVTGGALNAAQRNNSENPTPLAPQTNYTLVLSMHWTAYEFAAGHIIQVAISNSLFHMSVGSAQRFQAMVLVDAENTFFELPIVPRSPTPPEVPSFINDVPAPVPFRGGGCMFAERQLSDVTERDPTTNDTITRISDHQWQNIGGNVIEQSLEQQFVANDVDPARFSFLGEARHAIRFMSYPVQVIDGSTVCANDVPPTAVPGKGDTGFRVLELVTRTNVTTDANNFYVLVQRQLTDSGVTVANKTFQSTYRRVFQ